MVVSHAGLNMRHPIDGLGTNAHSGTSKMATKRFAIARRIAAPGSCQSQDCLACPKFNRLCRYRMHMPITGRHSRLALARLPLRHRLNRVLALTYSARQDLRMPERMSRVSWRWLRCIAPLSSNSGMALQQACRVHHAGLALGVMPNSRWVVMRAGKGLDRSPPVSG